MKRKIVLSMIISVIMTSFAGCKVENVDTNTQGTTSVATKTVDSDVKDDEPVISGIIYEGFEKVPNYHLPDKSMVEILKKNASGINTLSSSLIEFSSDDNENSAMISGFSAYSCLSAVSDYISGNSKEQINSALGEINVEALTYFKEHMPIETGSLFLIDDSTVLNTEKTDKFEFCDLQANDIVSFVNDYVSEKTHELIPTLISSPFDAFCRSVIIDTLYFKGTWAHKFDKNLTDKQIFYGTNRDVETDFMHTVHEFGVDLDNKVVELPYEFSNLVMDIVYDLDGNSVKDAFSDYVMSLDSGINFDYSYDVNLSMPKFETEYSIDVSKAFKALGMTDMFDPACSDDFKALADDIYVSDVVQKTKIKVDEEGTEAAAVTMMTMKTSSAMTEPKSVDIVVDKPFVYAIRDKETNIILFAGYVNGF